MKTLPHRPLASSARPSARARVALFCGGRGSATLVRALGHRGDVELTLIINAYDDGRSTGALRALLPGLPGPADFRKNLAVLLERTAPGTSRLLEARLAPDLADPRAAVARAILDEAASPHAGALGGWAEAFFAHLATRDLRLDLGDFAIGNLLFAGAWLACERDFNAALAALQAALDAPARLVNVDTGEARVLVGLKADGELLPCEAAIVGPQSPTPIAELFLLPAPLDPHLAPTRARLAALHRPTRIAPETAAALRGADLIVYGPGTQFSSLLPSYLARGVGAAIDEAAAAPRVFCANLAEDHDIQGLDAADLVDRALRFLGDPQNRRRRITHVLRDRHARASGARARASRRGAAWIEADLEDPARPGVHDGAALAARLLALCAAPRPLAAAEQAG